MNWRIIPKSNGRYYINENGEIVSVLTNKILKTYVNSAGYEIVTFELDGVKKPRQVHRLVAQAFIPLIKGKECVNHIDGNKLNNKASNLEWCTKAENTQHAFKMGLAKGTPHHEKSVIRSDGKTYKSMCDAARDLGVPYSYIRDVCTGRQKTTRGYTFSYMEGGVI